jgi:hypothetical protein
MLNPLINRALPLTSKSYGVRESKIIKQGAMGLNGLKCLCNEIFTSFFIVFSKKYCWSDEE